MRRISISLTLVLLALLVLATPALASRKWCAQDPIVRLNGADVGIWVSIPEEYVSLVNGAIEVKVFTPKGVSQQLIYLDAGFNGYGEVLTFASRNDLALRKDGSFDVVIEVWVPINKDGLKQMGVKSKSVPLQVTVIANGELVTHPSGVMEVVNGRTTVVEQTNDKTRIAFSVQSVK
jgi:hypothetical protein